MNQTPDFFDLLVADMVPPSDGVSDAEVQGLRFGSLAHVGRVLRHPVRPEALVIEIEVSPAPVLEVADTAPVWSLLHQMNHETRFEHGWTASLDDEALLVLSKVLPWRGLNPQQLKDWMADGLLRADSLLSLWQALNVVAPAEAQAPASPPTLLA
jgi:hypothetical protein